MYIVVEHAITNPDVFFGVAEKVAAAPPGFNALQFCPSISKDRAVCLWEAKSVDALKASWTLDWSEQFATPTTRWIAQ